MMTSSNEKYYVWLALCEGNPPVTGGFSSQRPVTWSFEIFFDLRLNKRLSKQAIHSIKYARSTVNGQYLIKKVCRVRAYRLYSIYMRRLGINLRFSCFVFFLGEMISSIIWIVASLRAANATFFVVSDNLFTSIVMFIICRKQLTSSRNSVAIELFLSMEFWKRKWIWMVICNTIVQLWRLHSLCSQINKDSRC